MNRRMDPLDRLAAAIDAAAGIRREIARLEAAFAREVAAASRAAEDLYDGRPQAEWHVGMRAVRAELATALRVSERQAERWVHESRKLVDDLPETLAALEAGAVSRRAAASVVESAWTLGLAGADGVVPEPGEVAARRAEFDERASALASRVAEHRLRGRLVALRDRLHPVAPAERHRAAAEERHVRVTPAEDGMAWLTAYLPAVEAIAIHDRLTRIAFVIRTSDEPVDPEGLFADQGEPEAEPESEGDERGAEVVPPARGHDETSLDRLRADLLVDHLVRGERIGRFDGIRPQVVVTVPALTLLDRPDPGGDPPELEGYGPIDPVTARRLTSEAPGLYRLLTDPHSGARLDLSRTSYRPSAELRLWLRLRDGTCRFPGCGRAAAHCDLDHTVAWAHGGPTSAGNLAHLCRAHHTLKHRSAWQPRQDPGGALTWTTPLGREVVV